MKRFRPHYRASGQALCQVVLLGALALTAAPATAQSAAAASTATATALPVPATDQQDGMYWLRRVMQAVREQNYRGIFVYHHGGRSETTRITHRFERGREQEHLEVLDGSPREVLRSDQEVQCFLPESRTVLIERRSQRHALPALLPDSLADLANYYVISKGAVERVAERDGQVVLLTPRDELRYAHRFWVDVASGLLLKAGMQDERGQLVETFVFTQLQVGGAIPAAALSSRWQKQSRSWQVRHIEASTADIQNQGWQFNQSLPGFRQLAHMTRRTPGGEVSGQHFVYSDGLAAISVFIDPRPRDELSPPLGMSRLGALNVYQRTLGDYRVLLLGEVPALALQRLGDGVSRTVK